MSLESEAMAHARSPEQRAAAWDDLAEDTAEQRARTLADFTGSQTTPEAKQALLKSFRAVSDPVKEMQGKPGWLSEEQHGTLDSIRKGCSKVALDNLDLTAFGLTATHMEDAKAKAISVATTLVSNILQKQGVTIPNMNAMRAMDGNTFSTRYLDDATVQKLGKGLGKGDQKFSAYKPEGFENLKANNTSPTSKELQAGALRTVTANGAWWIMQGLRAAYEKNNVEAKDPAKRQLGGVDAFSPELGFARLDSSIAIQAGDLSHMIARVYNSMYTILAPAEGEKTAVGDESAKEKAASIAVFTVVKDLMQ